MRQGTNLTTLTWLDAGSLVAESRNGVVLTNTYDGLLRRASVAVHGQAASRSEFGYDTASRLLVVSNAAAVSATYGYLAHSALVGELTFRRQGATRLAHGRTSDALNRLTDARTLALAGGVGGFSSAVLPAQHQWTDACQASLARVSGARLLTLDRGFTRFAGRDCRIFGA